MVPLLEVAPAVAGLYSGELSAQNRDQEVARATRWLQEPRVNPVRFLSNKANHRIDQLRRGEDFTMVDHSLTGLHE